MIGLSLIVSFLFLKLAKKRTLFLASFLMILLAVKSSTQVKTWKNSETLFTNALKVNGKSYISATNLGLYYIKEGRMDKVLFFFKKAEAIKPNDPLHQNNVGTALALTGKMDEAVIYFRKAVAFGPKNLEGHTNLIHALIALGRTKEAVARVSKIYKAPPKQPKTARLYRRA